MAVQPSHNPPPPPPRAPGAAPVDWPATPTTAATGVPNDWLRGFWSLIVTQFQTAFNDNALKFLVIYVIVAMNFAQQRRDMLVLVVGALFAIPFILFSMTGGFFADRFSKRTVTIGTKLLEGAVMIFFI